MNMILTASIQSLNEGLAIGRTVKLFVILLLTGALIGFLFDFFRAMRRAMRRGGAETPCLFVHIQDVLFLLASFTVLLLVIYAFNDGQLRAFMLLAAAVGVHLYYLIVSPVSNRIIFYIFYITILAIKYIFLKPAMWIGSVFLKICAFAGKKLKKTTRPKQNNDI